MRLTVLFCAVLLLGATAPPSPEEDYRARIAAQNAGYATDPHAMLKIQDSVYLAAGQSAVLTGTKGDTASWRWQPAGTGPLRVTIGRRGPQVLLGAARISADRLAAGLPVDEGIDVQGQPTQLSAGVTGWRLFVYNQRHPAATGFAGVAYYPFDPAFILQASFTPDARLTPHSFPTSRGTTKRFFHVGDARFSLQGQELQLPFYADDNDPRHLTQLSAFFTDELTGKGAYGAGRYLEVAVDRFPPAGFSIDFNAAYNPNCARSPHFTCPLAGDNLPVRVSAGERDPHAPQVGP